MFFHFPVFLPGIKQECSFKEITNRDYRVLSKFLQNKNDQHTAECMEQLVSDLSVEDISKLNLSRLDLFCILATIRAMSVGPDVKLTMRCTSTDKTYGATVDIMYIVQQLVTSFDDLSDNVINLTPNISIVLSIPRSLWINTTDPMDLLLDCLVSITINKKQYNMNNMCIREKLSIADNLPGGVVNQVINHCTQYSEQFEDITFLTDRSPYDETDTGREYKLNMFNSSMFDFLKLIYTQDLNSVYRSTYMLVEHTGFSGEYVDTITPVESNIFLKYKTDEIEKQKAAQQSQQRGGTSVGAPIPGMMDI